MVDAVETEIEEGTTEATETAHATTTARRAPHVTMTETATVLSPLLPAPPLAKSPLRSYHSTRSPPPPSAPFHNGVIRSRRKQEKSGWSAEREVKFQLDSEARGNKVCGIR